MHIIAIYAGWFNYNNPTITEFEIAYDHVSYCNLLCLIEKNVFSLTGFIIVKLDLDLACLKSEKHFIIALVPRDGGKKQVSSSRKAQLETETTMYSNATRQEAVLVF